MIRIIYLLSLFVKYSCLYVLKKLGLYHKSNPKFLRNFFEEISGSFIKFGQLLALRVDLVPEEYSLEMLDLLDNLAPFPYPEVRKIFLRELGAYPEQVFKSFEEVPFAAASFGQVHGAILADGQKVVVKVLRPNIEQDVAIDYMFIYLLAMIADLFFTVHSFSWRGFAQEFNRWTKQELDYRLEAANAEKFSRFYQESSVIVIPKTYHHFTTQRILVQDYIEGFPLSRVLRGLKDGRLNKRKLTELGVDIANVPHLLTQELIKQYFIHKTFHADPHPGNIILLKDNKIGLVDFGIVGNAISNNERDFVQSTYHTVHFHFEEAVFYFARFTTREFQQIIISAFPATIDSKKSDDLIKTLADHFATEVKRIIFGNAENLLEMKKDYSRVVFEVIKAGELFKVKVPNEILLFMRVISINGMLGKQLNKGFLITEEIKYFFRQNDYEQLVAQTPPSQPLRRINRERAWEKFGEWIIMLQETDRATYQVVKKHLESYNAIT